jgi:1,4-alpha-glucan branching enzyme
MSPSQNLELIRSASHPDPFSYLGIHGIESGPVLLRCFLPGAQSVTVLDAQGAACADLTLLHPDGLYEGVVPLAVTDAYQLHITWTDGQQCVQDDPYRFPLLLGEMDVWLLGEGTHLRPFEVLGAHPCSVLGVSGTRFAVWAPNASRVSMVGDFNMWDGRRHPMRMRRECGVWELFIPGIHAGARYKYEVRTQHGEVLPQRADPYALQSELRPATASVVGQLPEKVVGSSARQRANALDAPVSIYEVHLGSWRRITEEGNRWLTWDELADTLVPYAQDMGFTHLELMPVSEHPFDGSWGYQPIGIYAPTARFGEAAGFGRLVARCHAAGIGLIVDWVPAHFPTDAHGLANFDGTQLYEYADPREGFHNDWNTLIYNLGRTEVKNFLVGNALYWLERFGVDGLRVDAVASMLYRDYSREDGQWIPNIYGGRENLEAIAFLKRMNEVVGVERPQAITLAEESTAYPAVSRPTFNGGLGFHYKWNMGWMHDTLAYMARDPLYRQHHHGEMTFSLVYAFNENFVLPISHDEVVHGKGSLLTKMPGDRWQQMANVRTFLGYMFGHPGKKLLFMGCEFAQEREWNHDHSLDWHLLERPQHAGVQRLVRDLNRIYRDTPALYTQDFVPAGFQWLEYNDNQHSVLSFVRWDVDQASFVVVICNFTPNVWSDYRLGLPRPGRYEELLNTDAQIYGGSGINALASGDQTDDTAWHDQHQSILLQVPPLATVFLKWTA